MLRLPPAEALQPCQLFLFREGTSRGTLTVNFVTDRSLSGSSCFNSFREGKKPERSRGHGGNIDAGRPALPDGQRTVRRECAWSRVHGAAALIATHFLAGPAHMGASDAGMRLVVLLVVWTCGSIRGSTSSMSLPTGGDIPAAPVAPLLMACDSRRPAAWLLPDGSAQGPGGRRLVDADLVRRVRGGGGLKPMRGRPPFNPTMDRPTHNGHDRMDRPARSVGRPPGRRKSGKLSELCGASGRALADLRETILQKTFNPPRRWSTTCTAGASRQWEQLERQWRRTRSGRATSNSS